MPGVAPPRPRTRILPAVWLLKGVRYIPCNALVVQGGGGIAAAGGKPREGGRYEGTKMCCLVGGEGLLR